MTKEELEKIEEAARWQENYDKQLKDIKKFQKACHKWFMRWREAKKDALYFDSSLQKQIEATLKLQQENEELKKQLEDADNATDVFNAQEKRIAELEAQIEKMKCCYNCSKWYDGECEESPKSKTFFCADFKCDEWEVEK